MFKCAICGKEYSDKDMNEICLLNRQTNEIETFHVCATCLNNKEDMVAYLADKKGMSVSEARHLYDYFVPLTDEIESPLLRKYIEVRVNSLRGKLAENINAPVAEVKGTGKKKASVYKRLKASLITLDAVLSVALFVIFVLIAVTDPGITAASVVMGLILSIGVFVAGYFVFDSYVGMREQNYKVLKKLKDTFIVEDEPHIDENKNNDNV